MKKSPVTGGYTPEEGATTPPPSPHAQIRAASEARLREEEQQLVAAGFDLPVGGGVAPPEITDAFVDECLERNARGDGELFAAVHQGQFIKNMHADEWLVWAGHYWDPDVLLQVENAVDVVATRLQARRLLLQEARREALALDEKDQARKYEARIKRYSARINRLRTLAGVQSCVKFAAICTGGLGRKGDLLDADPYLFACENGVIDLRLGECRPGRPEDMLTKHGPAAWQGLDAPAPRWEAFVLEVLDKDDAMVAYVQRVLGYAMTGLTEEHFLPVFYGEGRNGKSTLLEMVQQVMGNYGWSVNVELLLEQRGGGKSSAGPSPDIMSLRGRRLAVAAEPPQGSRWNIGKVKQLTGGDTLTGRNPNDKYEICFSPSHTLVLCSNERPTAGAGGDFAFWQRVQLVPFLQRYVNSPNPDNPREHKKDPQLRRALQEELPGILAWLVRGCLEWQRRGIDPPAQVLEATREYQRDEDLLQEFLDSCCEHAPGKRVSASGLYAAYVEWYESHVGKRVPSQKAFGEQMKKRGFSRVKSNGLNMYVDLQRKQANSVPT